MSQTTSVQVNSSVLKHLLVVFVFHKNHSAHVQEIVIVSKVRFVVQVSVVLLSVSSIVPVSMTAIVAPNTSVTKQVEVVFVRNLAEKVQVSPMVFLEVLAMVRFVQQVRNATKWEVAKRSV